MNQKKRLMIMAGGTGGHVLPGLSVARYFINHGWIVRWLGTANRIEADLVPKHGIEIDFIHIVGIRNKSIKSLFRTLILLLRAWNKARIIMMHFQPNVVLGMGSYVSGPGILAAWSLGIPIVLHEQNSIAGLTNKYLAKIATKVMQAFPGVLPNAELVGNPVRLEVLALPIPRKRFIGRNGPVRVLVLGGSQGAHILNQIMPCVAKKLKNAITIWHQTGKNEQKKVEQAYERLGILKHRVSGFIEDIASAYAWADVAICRSGALTVSEISAAGLAAIFVPFQHKDQHQHWNALPLTRIGSAKIIEQSHLTADEIAITLKSWNRKALLEMAERSRATATLDATEKIANQIRLAAKR